jgi:uncharacterized SAM-binding protein YcdF (DUF218 family)
MKLRSPLTALSSRRSRLVAILCVGALWFVAWGSARLLIVSAPLEHADVIVVLSGSSTFVERTQLAAQLYAAGRAEKIVLTNDNRQGGWVSAEQRNPYFYERARWELQRQGIPAARIEVIGPPVNGTRDEALALRKYAAANGVNSVLLVTSAYHSRRALWTFRRLLSGTGVTLGMSPTTPGRQTPRPLTWWLHLRGWQMVPTEYVKLAYYWARL